MVQKSETTELDIPPGVESGATMHVSGRGNDGIGGGHPGDLYLVLDVKSDKRFEHDGQTLYTHIDLTFAQAALGDGLEIEGVDGSLELDVPAGPNPTPRSRSGRGSASVTRGPARRPYRRVRGDDANQTRCRSGQPHQAIGHRRRGRASRGMRKVPCSAACLARSIELDRNYRRIRSSLPIGHPTLILCGLRGCPNILETESPPCLVGCIAQLSRDRRQRGCLESAVY